MSDSTVSGTTFGLAVGVLSAVLAAEGYVLYKGHVLLVEQQASVRSLTDQVESAHVALQSMQRSTAEASAAYDRSHRDLMTQVAAVRVAIQQSSSIRFDKSGAVVTKKGQPNDGIELR